MSATRPTSNLEGQVICCSGFSSPRLAVFTTTLEPGLPLPNMRCLFRSFCRWDSCLLFRLHDRWASSSPQLIRGCLFGKALFTPALYFYRNVPYQPLGRAVSGLRPPLLVSPAELSLDPTQFRPIPLHELTRHGS